MSAPFSKLAILCSTVFTISLCSFGTMSWAQDDEEIPFSEAHIFFELNNTDGDLGIHALLDGDPWKKLEIEDPKGRKMLDIKVKGRLKKQGLTEIFFESAEPTFDELSPQEFFSRFRQGTYEIEAKTLEGKELESEVELSHIMPAPPEPTINGLPHSQQCDEENPGFDVTITSAPVTISWPAVQTSHPDPNGGGAAVQPTVPVQIHNYEVVVEVELDVNGEEFPSVMHVVLPPGETSLTIPGEFLDQGEEFKYEVLAREANFNQTAVESCFVVE